MDPYKPCWCQSGKKWKWCHKNRHIEKPVPVGQVFASIFIEFTKGYCSYPGAGPATCGDKIIRAHTVQRATGLAAIAENGQVISAKSAFRDLVKNDWQLVPREVGIHDASTFMGFCNRHDAAMFRAVEAGTIVLEQKTCFLLAFRALAFELFEKQAQFRHLEVLRDTDKGRPFEDQCYIQSYLHYRREGIVRGLADIQQWKAAYDAAFVEQQFDAFSFVGVVFSCPLPVVCCGGFYPEFDFEGRPLQRLGRPVALQHVTYNLTVVKDRTVAVFGWTGGDNGPAAEFVRSFVKLSPTGKAEAAVRLGFEHIGNCYMKSSWWASLPEQARGAAITRLASGGTAVPRRSNCLEPDGFAYATDIEAVETLWF
jgi:hypothetical protein